MYVCTCAAARLYETNKTHQLGMSPWSLTQTPPMGPRYQAVLPKYNSPHQAQLFRRVAYFGACRHRSPLQHGPDRIRTQGLRSRLWRSAP